MNKQTSEQNMFLPVYPEPIGGVEVIHSMCMLAIIILVQAVL